jgi:hypothetical protein
VRAGLSRLLRTGGRDVIPLHRDAVGTPDANPALLQVVGSLLGAGVDLAPDDLFAYCYGILAGSDYTLRFTDDLRTPGPRVPLSADANAFFDAANLGYELLWLHTYGERFAEGRAGLPSSGISVSGTLSLPEKSADIKYDANNRALRIGTARSSVSGPTYGPCRSAACRLCESGSAIEPPRAPDGRRTAGLLLTGSARTNSLTSGPASSWS